MDFLCEEHIGICNNKVILAHSINDDTFGFSIMWINNTRIMLASFGKRDDLDQHFRTFIIVCVCVCKTNTWILPR